MKPRLRLWRGLWRCFQPGVLSREPLPAGLGYTPQEAYADWWQRTRKHWLETTSAV